MSSLRWVYSRAAMFPISMYVFLFSIEEYFNCILPDGSTVTTGGSPSSLQSSTFHSHATQISTCDYTNKDQLWLTNPRDALHHGERAANKVDAQCDKLATELSWQSLASKVANLQLHLHLANPLGMTPFELCRDFWHQKTRVHGLWCGVVCVILRLTLSVEHRLVTDGPTDRHTTTANTRAS